MNIQQALVYGKTQCAQADNNTNDTGELDSQVLLCHVLCCNRAKLIAWPEQELSDTEHQQFHTLIEQRQQGTPVAYLTGHREFWSLDLTVTPATLIPRPDTELLVETILQRFDSKQLKLADLGTGSGAIAIAIASERPHWNIVATDISNAALDVARSNAKKHQINNIQFFQGTWFAPLKNSHFDIIASNPPYIASDDQHLSIGDVRFEPDQALVSGPTGMDDIEYLCQHATKHLNAGGLILLEHGYDQQQDVLNCLQKNQFNDIIQLKDLAGHVRVSLGRVN